MVLKIFKKSCLICNRCKKKGIDYLTKEILCFCEKKKILIRNAEKEIECKFFKDWECTCKLCRDKVWKNV